MIIKKYTIGKSLQIKASCNNHDLYEKAYNNCRRIYKLNNEGTICIVYAYGSDTLEVLITTAISNVTEHELQAIDGENQLIQKNAKVNVERCNKKGIHTHEP